MHWVWEGLRMRKLKINVVLAGVSLVVVWGLGGCAATDRGNGNGAVKAPEPTSRMARVSGTDYETLGRGYSAYIKQCAQCHEYKLPDDLSRAEWHQENWNVGMEKEDGQALIQYLLAEIKTR